MPTPGKKKAKPAQVRYTQERRWLKNKLRRILKNNTSREAEEFRRRYGI